MSAAFQPATPYELVEGTEHHGPYICTSWGSTVCDFYTMTDPSMPSVRNGGTSKPVWFTDAAAHAAFMVKAANVHGELLAALKDARFALYGRGPGNPTIDAAITKAEGRS